MNAHHKPRPNILWLTCDHLLYAHHKDLDGYPHLATYARLAQTGTCFSNAFSVSPICQPARASMLTGVYPHRHGMTHNEGDAGSRIDFDPDQRLISHYLAEAGYRLGYFGKWHTGDQRNAQDYGFEGFSTTGYGHPYYTDTYQAYLAEQGLPEPKVEIEWNFGDPTWEGRTVALKDFPQPYQSPYFLMESCGILRAPVETHEAFFLAHLASQWLQQNAGQGQPFCLRVDTWGPHHPYFVAEPFLNTIDPASLTEYPNFNSTLADRPANHRALLDYRIQHGSFRNWPAWQPILARAHEHAAQVDAAFGRILDTLEQLGLMDDTLILYTADHGGALGSNGGLVDKGWLMTEETVRIPLALRWAGQIPAGQQSQQLVSNMDLVPTVLAAAGAGRPDPLDGESLLPLCAQPENPAWRQDLLLEHHGHYHENHFQRQLRYRQYKYTAHLDDLDELYDLDADPYERHNLIQAPDRASLRAELRSRLLARMAEYQDQSAEAVRLRQQLATGHPV